MPSSASRIIRWVPTHRPRTRRLTEARRRRLETPVLATIRACPVSMVEACSASPRRPRDGLARTRSSSRFVRMRGFQRLSLALRPTTLSPCSMASACRTRLLPTADASAVHRRRSRAQQRRPSSSSATRPVSTRLAPEPWALAARIFRHPEVLWERPSLDPLSPAATAKQERSMLPRWWARSGPQRFASAAPSPLPRPARARATASPYHRRPRRTRQRITASRSPCHPCVPLRIQAPAPTTLLLRTEGWGSRTRAPAPATVPTPREVAAQ